jgi:hypothetical protein
MPSISGAFPIRGLLCRRGCVISGRGAPSRLRQLNSPSKEQQGYHGKDSKGRRHACRAQSVIFVLLLEKLEGRMDEIAERVARDRTHPPHDRRSIDEAQRHSH